MKKIMSFMLFISLIGFLAACASEPDEEPAQDASEGENNGGGSLIVAVGSDATYLDPHMGTDIPSANVYHNRIFETLVIQDENMEFQPGLATEWERVRSEEHTSELQSRGHLVCRLLLEKKKKQHKHTRCRTKYKDT